MQKEITQEPLEIILAELKKLQDKIDNMQREILLLTREVGFLEKATHNICEFDGCDI